MLALLATFFSNSPPFQLSPLQPHTRFLPPRFLPPPDHSRTCSSHLSPTFGLSHHQSCVVHGGDGLAFVLHNDPAGDSALGGTGGDLGYGGISNGLAVELDMWTNAPSLEGDSGDLFADHVAVHASGPGGVLGSDKAMRLGASRAHHLADGEVHIVQVK